MNAQYCCTSRVETIWTPSTYELVELPIEQTLSWIIYSCVQFLSLCEVILYSWGLQISIKKIDELIWSLLSSSFLLVAPHPGSCVKVVHQPRVPYSEKFIPLGCSPITIMEWNGDKSNTRWGWNGTETCKMRWNGTKTRSQPENVATFIDLHIQVLSNRLDLVFNVFLVLLCC